VVGHNRGTELSGASGAIDCEPVSIGALPSFDSTLSLAAFDDADWSGIDDLGIGLSQDSDMPSVVPDAFWPTELLLSDDFRQGPPLDFMPAPRLGLQTFDPAANNQDFMSSLSGNSQHHDLRLHPI
jgi:hypothetical protein